MNKKLFARVVNGEVDIFKESKLTYKGKVYFSPNERIMRLAGYKPFVIPAVPKLNEGEYLIVDFADRGEWIENVYTITGGNV